ncbi:MAG: division/cell wall cluster transcriptional repressor MraZ [Candidatus Dactylopiibacterium sp.]|nr:division/cell wall cluster transcriptional repressor MraZ [Candidatus Dactylopiibacterium sp.]
MPFQGASVLSLDAKGRVTIPARHRDALMTLCGGNLVLTTHPHGCLMVYPLPAWEPVRDALLAIPGIDRGSQDLKRLLVGNALDEPMDASGRVSVSASLRKWAKLDKQVRLMGLGKYFELWSEDIWEQRQTEAAERFQSGELPPGFESIAL